ncbi:MAG: HutD family protein [Elusimicrobiota bacterium]
MRLLTSAVSRRIPWKNGRGFTLEIATDAPAPGGDWTWRLSMAEVPSRAPFSVFPGIDRFIACLTGPGLALERAGVRAIAPREGDALAFAGEECVIGEPLGCGVRDVNLMLRRDLWRGRMTLARGRPLEIEAPLVLVYAPPDHPALRAATAQGVCGLSAGETLVASGRVAISGAPGGAAVACELTPVVRPAP